jgi:hypothetical protein
LNFVSRAHAHKQAFIIWLLLFGKDKST